MQTIYDNYIHGLLADATYVEGISETMTVLQLKDALSTRMTPTLAKFIADNFVVASHIETNDGFSIPPESGFDATVWRGRAGTSFAGKMYVSMRGTTPPLQDFLTDVNLAVNGNARDQVIDMMNWWLRITTPVGEMARQFRETFSELNDPPRSYEKYSVAGTGRISADELHSGVQVDGHSLGGYLATAFMRLFGAQAHVVHTATFNSAGFAPGSESVFTDLQSLLGVGYGLGRFPSGTEQTNFFAAHGINVTTNSFWFNQQGTRVSLFNEEGSAPANHFMFKLTDSLALASALEKLDPSMTIGRANALFEAGSNQVAASLEGVLNGLRRLLLDPRTGDLPVGDVNDSNPSRVVYHQTLLQLIDSAAFQSLVGKVRIDLSSVALGGRAREDFSALASLILLSPVVLTGMDASLDSTLQSVWGQTYTDWRADRTMSLADRADGMANYSDQWLTDRAKMLSWLMERNERNFSADKTIPTAKVSSIESWQFEDRATLTTIKVGGDSLMALLDRHYVIFGKDDAGDTIDGNDERDNLYGNAGADTINGGADADYLEGNADADSLLGGEGKDILLGGTGADTLIGGVGSDTLTGGKDADTYRFSSGDGTDTIYDADGTSTIIVNGATLTLGKADMVAGKTYTDTTNSSIKYTLMDRGGGVQDLLITYGPNDSILVKNHQSATSGITLAAADPVTYTPGPVTGTFEETKQYDIAHHYLGSGYEVKTAGAYIDASGNVAEAASPDYSHINYFRAYEHGGNDTLIGGTGSDFFYGAGAGGEVLVGNGGQDIVYINGAGSRVYVERETTDIDNADNSGAASGQVGSMVWATRDATVVGGSGDDLIVADSGGNVIQLGAGANTYVGGITGGGVVNAPWVDWLKREDGSERYVLNFDSYSSDAIRTWGGTGWVYTYAGPLAFDDNFDGNQNNGGPVGRGNDTILGGSGTNHIVLSNGDNTVDIGLGHNSVWGGAGNDTILGGSEGHDQIAAQGGDDLVILDGSNNTVWAGTGNNAVYGGDGADLIYAGTHTKDGVEWYDSNAHGGSYIEGGNLGSVIYGSGGTDELFGGAGSDVIYAGNGEEYADGGEGDDAIVGLTIDSDSASVTGNSVLVGGAGNDTIIGGSGATTIYGGEGADVIVAGDGPTVIYVEGEDTGSVITLGDGDATVHGGNGADLITAGDGNAVIYAGNGGVKGAPTIVQAGSGNVTVYGGAGVDYIQGGSGINLLHAGYGGTADAPTIIQGGSGNTTLLSGAGVAQLIGGTGTNTYVLNAEGGETTIFNHGSAATVEFGEGISADNLFLTAQLYADGQSALLLSDGAGGMTTILGGLTGAIQNFGFNSGTTLGLHKLMQQGIVEEQRFVQSNAALLLSVTDGESLVGGSGNDTLFGYGANDTLVGGAGNATLAGGGGNATYVIDVRNAHTEIQNSNSTDTLQFDTGIRAVNLTASVATTDGISVVTMHDASRGDTIVIRGTESGMLSRVMFSDGGTTTLGDVVAQSMGGVGTVTHPDGTTTKIVGDGHGNATATLFDAGGARLSDTWTKSGGSSGTDAFHADGSSSGTTTYVDDSRSTYTNDGHGNVLTLDFNALGVKTGDSWSGPDGRTGSDTFNSDGSSTGIIRSPDGSYSTYANDGKGNIHAISYDATGAQTGESWTLAEGTARTVTDDGEGDVTTSIYTSGGTKIGDVWSKADGSHGSDNVHADGSSAGVAYRADGSYSTYTDDGQGRVVTRFFGWDGRLTGSSASLTNGNDNTVTSYLNASGMKVSETWRHGDGSSGADSVSGLNLFGANNLISQGPLHTYWSTDTSYWAEAYRDGNLSGGVYAFQLDTNITPKDSRSIDFRPDLYYRYNGYASSSGDLVTFDISGAMPRVGDFSIGERRDGTVLVGGTVIGSERTAYTTSLTGSDGSKATLVLDGLGNMVMTTRDATGKRIGDIWLHNDGTNGADLFKADGSSEGFISNLNGTVATHTNDGHGKLTTSSLPPTISGSISVVPSHTATPAPASLDIAPAGGTWIVADMGTGTGPSEWEARFLPEGTIHIGRYDAHGTHVSDSTVITDPGYATTVYTAGKKVVWNYDVFNNPTSSTIDDGSGSITTYEYDFLGQLKGYGVATHDGSGNLNTRKYSVAGVLTGSSATVIEGGKTVTTDYDASGALLKITKMVADGNGNIVTSAYDASGALLSITTMVITAPNQTIITNYDSHRQPIGNIVTSTDSSGVITTSSYDGTGKLINVVVAKPDASGNVTTTNYDAAGKLTSYILSTSDASGNISIAIHDANGFKLQVNALAVSGVQTRTTYQPNGASLVTTHQLDSTFNTTSNDGRGEVVSTDYDALGTKLRDSWTNADGSRGTDTFNSDGTSSGSAVNADGTRITYATDASDTTTTRHYLADGVTVTGTSVTTHVDGKITTTNFDTSGRKLNDAWVQLDGASGRVFYHADGSGAGTGVNIDGTTTTTTDDGHGNVTTLQFSLSGVKIGDSWTKADGSHGTNTFNADGSTSGKTVNPDGTFTTYANSGKGDVTTTYFNADGLKLSDTWTKADGSHGTDTFNPDGSSTGTGFNADGTYSTTVGDGKGNVTTTIFSASGVKIGDTWVKADGTHGTDTFNPDGTTSGQTFNPDGSYSTYTTFVVGGKLTNLYDKTGFKYGDITVNEFGDITTERFNPDGSGSDEWHYADGSYGTDTWNADGSGSDTWHATDGTHGSDIWNADGSSSGSEYSADGSYYSYADDGVGDVTRTFYDQDGVKIRLEWTKADGSSGSETYTGNQPPVVASGVADQNVDELKVFKFVMPSDSFTDPNADDALSYQVTLDDGSALPSWLVFDVQTNTLSGTPADSDVGMLNLKVTATDKAGLSATSTFNLTVKDVNQAPLVSQAINDQTTDEAKAFSFVVPADTFTDPDRADTLVYAASLGDGSILPSWLKFDAATLTFSGTPQDADTGVLNNKVTATDGGGLSAATAFTLAVNNVNQAPVMSLQIADQTALEEKTFTYVVPKETFTDPDAADVLSFSATLADGNALPSWLSFDAKTGTFSGTPVHADAGTLNITITATDPSGITATDAFALNVKPTTSLLILGTAEADNLVGTKGNDTLIGAAGNDSLAGGVGNDIYVYNWDDGLDLITDAGGNDAVKFGTGLTLDNVALRLTTDNGVTTAHIRVLDASGTEQGNQGIDFVMSKDSKGSWVSPIETFQFADGSQKTWTDLQIQTVVSVGDRSSNTITTGRNDDIIFAGQNKHNTIHSGSGNDIVFAFNHVDSVNGGGGDDVLIGGTDNDSFNGEAGYDILLGGEGDDVLTDKGVIGSNILFGDKGNDTITGGQNADFIAGGRGDDLIKTGAGANIVAFNKQDGSDTVLATADASNTLSLGRGIKNGDLSFQKAGNDLILNTGSKDKITFKDWYADTKNHDFVNLQIIEDASSDYKGSSKDKLVNKRIVDFDFGKLVTAFDNAWAKNPKLVQWSLTNGLQDAFVSGSDTAAFGGDLAYQYAKTGNLGNISMTPALAILHDASFGTTQQNLQLIGVLHDASLLLM